MVLLFGMSSCLSQQELEHGDYNFIVDAKQKSSVVIDIEIEAENGSDILVDLEVEAERGVDVKVTMKVDPDSNVAVIGGGQVPRKLTVMTYNIKACQGLTGDGSIDRIANIINSVKPDIVFLQEVDVDVVRSGSVNQVEQLSKLTGLYGAFAPSILLGRGFYGTALLSRFKINDATRLALPRTPEFETRAALVCQLEVTPDFTIDVISVHLSYEEDALRDRQAAVLLKELALSDADMVIAAGDFNASPDTKTVSLFEGFFNAKVLSPDILTCPTHNPIFRIDYIFSKSNIDSQVGNSSGETNMQPNNIIRIDEDPSASDHYPLVSQVIILQDRE